jgi:hypothetical protein
MLFFKTPAFAKLYEYPQFITYVLRPGVKPGKMDKIPACGKTGVIGVNPLDPSVWADVDTAAATASRIGGGVGFVFTEKDPFFFLDIDGCVTKDGTDWTAEAKYFLQLFSGAAVEVSSSRRGLHIFGTGDCPPHACKYAPLGLELYTSGRFAALTGAQASGDISKDCSQILPLLVNTYFQLKGADSAAADWTESPVTEWRGPSDDEQLLTRAMRSVSMKAAAGVGASFADLFTKNVSILSSAYPADDRPFDESSADAALAQHLAFWTGKDCARILRLMQKSELRRDKWERDDYMRRTILNACSMARDVLQDRAAESPSELPPASAESPKIQRLERQNKFLTVDEQAALFAGCVYVADRHKIMVPGGEEYSAEQFNVLFGGRSFLTDELESKVSFDAFKAFTQNTHYRPPMAMRSTFDPRQPPGAIIGNEVNSYYPVQIERKQGDTTPFFKYFEMLLPSARDRQILLCYMAALVQFPGVKFKWAPFIQGVEGNGKSFLLQVMLHAVGREYSHFLRAKGATANFNSWRYRKIFVGIDDLYISDDLKDLMEDIKEMVTNPLQEIESKGRDKIMRAVCFNLMICSNHKNAIKKHESERRVAMFYTAQQKKGDLITSGIGDYVHKTLYPWAESGGYAILAELLHTYPIPDEYNPALGGVAPDTSSLAEALTVSRGNLEDAFIEAVESATVPGFMGGWVSSLAFDRWLASKHSERIVPMNRRREFLESCGYILHPALSDGRTSRIVSPDGGRPRLYVKKGHSNLTLGNPSDIVNAYEKSQSLLDVSYLLG